MGILKGLKPEKTMSKANPFTKKNLQKNSKNYNQRTFKLQARRTKYKIFYIRGFISFKCSNIFNRIPHGGGGGGH